MECPGFGLPSRYDWSSQRSLYSEPFWWEAWNRGCWGEKKDDGSSKKGKDKKKGWRFGKMTAEFDPEVMEPPGNETGEDFGVDLFNRNETVEEEPAQNGTMQSVPASDMDLGWSKEDKKIWVKYGLSPAYLREMRKIVNRLLGEHVCSTVDILEGKPLGACTCLLYTSPSPRDKRQSRMPSSA